MSKTFIIGTSGIGKTTLAKHIAEITGIPFINGSSSTLWEEYDIKNHKEVIEMGIKDPLRGLQFQLDLLKYREKITRNLPEFITDRSIIDNVVYFLLQNAPYLNNEDTGLYLAECRASLNRICGKNFKDVKIVYLTRHFYVNDAMPKIIADGKRIENEYYQDLVDNIFRHVIKDDHTGFPFLEYGNFLELRDYNFEKRVDKVKTLLHKW